MGLSISMQTKKEPKKEIKNKIVKKEKKQKQKGGCDANQKCEKNYFCVNDGTCTYIFEGMPYS
jgi:hypothetical protein